MSDKKMTFLKLFLFPPLQKKIKKNTADVFIQPNSCCHLYFVRRLIYEAELMVRIYNIHYCRLPIIVKEIVFYAFFPMHASHREARLNPMCGSIDWFRSLCLSPHATENKTYVLRRCLRNVNASLLLGHFCTTCFCKESNMTSCVRKHWCSGRVCCVSVCVCVASGSNRRYYYVITTALKLVCWFGCRCGGRVDKLWLPVSQWISASPEVFTFPPPSRLRFTYNHENVRSDKTKSTGRIKTQTVLVAMVPAGLEGIWGQLCCSAAKKNKKQNTWCKREFSLEFYWLLFLYFYIRFRMG